MINNIRTEGLRPLRFGSMRELMEQRCGGAHDIYVAEVFYVLAEGNAVVVTVCRACNLVKFHTQQIAQPNAIVEMLKTKEKV